MTYSTIVSTDILAGNIDASWAIVDCRFDLQNDTIGRAHYLEAHIPGAVYASLNDDLAGPRTGSNGRHPLPTIDALASLFGRFGIERNTQVVVYDQDAGLYASRAWWSLRYLGHDAVALLDGGWAKWVREGRPTRGGEESRTPVHFQAQPRPRMHVSVDDVMARMTDGKTRLVDARGAERFEGRSEPLDRVAGHIPGAGNHFYKSNLADDGTLLPADALRERFAQTLAGAAPADTIMYCGSGVSACHNLLAMEHAGLTGTPLYPGSWSEWSSDAARPVEKGPAIR